MRPAAALVLALLGSVSQSPVLRIVVVEGEGAVNIIQQKTAVAPVVELRDRNDLPVPGASVTFSINGGNATFAGSQTVTVTTNAAGRAAVSALNPVSPGAVQINVSASAQGQSVTAVITQTNFATAAAATAAGAAVATGAGAGAGAAAGGGISAAAIAGIVGGAGAAAAAVGVKAARGGDENDVNAVSCTYSVSPQTFSVPSAAAQVVVDVTINADPPRNVDNCNVQVTSNAEFLFFLENSTVRNGTNARITISVGESVAFGGSPRTGTVTVAGQTVTVIQKGKCSFRASPLEANVPASGGVVVITMTGSPDGCDGGGWEVIPPPNAPGFLTFSQLSGTTNGQFAITVTPNPNFTARTSAISVPGAGEGQIVRIIQSPRTD